MNTEPSVPGVPSSLESPPSGGVAPPVVSLYSVLPCELLTWKNFERLCVRLTRLEAEIEHSQLYGVGGQSQEGIDLYARAFDGSYSVSQCKRIENLGPSELRKAVTKFLEGSWAKRAKKFVFCTSKGALRTKLAEEREEQTQRLKAEGVEFAVWDCEEISNLLKSQPRLVFDFFGPPWVEVFLGRQALETLGSRLDSSKVNEFRTKLRKFYDFLFAVQDPGIPVPPRPGVESISILDRFVSQDVYVDEGMKRAAFSGADQRLEQAGAQEYGNVARFAHQDHDGKLKNLPAKPLRTRESMSSWLARSKNSLITGGPGSGKSSLLRYVALEVLTENLGKDRIAVGRGEALPVWLPFGFWTRRIAEEGSIGVTQCAREWLEFWSQGELWPLVEKALEDERVLLLVDGLDEAANQDAGRAAIQQLQVFIGTHETSVITTSRPLFNVGVNGANWQAAELAALSDAQRAEVCSKWFAIRKRMEGGPESSAWGHELFRHQSDAFVEELNGSHDLEQLSRVPLLLLLLMFLRFRNAMLPRDRFQAYAKVVDYLLEEHPAVRRAAASQIGPQGVTLQDVDVRSILARVAFEIQVDTPEGVIPLDSLHGLVGRFLNDSDGLNLDLGNAELRLYGAEFIRHVRDSSGILLSQGTDTVGFLHRALQEYLAALHIASWPLAAISQLFVKYGPQLAWREVILNVLSQLNRPDEVGQLLKSLKASVGDSVQEFYARELVTEAACTDMRCPADLARQLVTDAVRHVEDHDWLSHRRRLVRHLMVGLNIPRTKEILRGALKRWIFRSGTWRPAWYDALSSWEKREDVLGALITSLNDEEFEVQRAAAKALGVVGRGDGPTGDRVAKIAGNAIDVSHSAAALRALSLGWPDHEKLPGLLKNATQSRSRWLRLTGTTASVRLGHRDIDLFTSLVEDASGDPLNRPYQWTEEIAECLSLGWKGSA